MPIRAFVAAFPAPAERQRIYDAIEGLRRAYEGGRHRWTPAGSYHLTFRFLGAIDDADVPQIRQALTPVAAATGRCRCTTADIEVLPSARRPRVIALAIESGGSLEALGNGVQSALTAQFGAADRPFRAHLSVIRCNAGARITVLPAPPATDFDITTLGLYRSDTLAVGARYTRLFELPLG